MSAARQIGAIVVTVCLVLGSWVTAQEPEAEHWYNIARRLVKEGEKNKALEAYDRSVALDSTSSIAWANRGTLLLNMHRYDEALESYDRSLALRPASAYVYCSRATVFNRVDKPGLALQSADKAISCNGDFWGAWLNKAAALETFGRTEEAQTCRVRAQEINPALRLEKIR